MHVLISALHRPSKPTGVCRHAANLARCLADSDRVTQITLVTGAWQKHYFETSFNLTSKKIRFTDVDTKNNSLSRNIWFLFGLPKLVNNLRPDLVHLSFPLPFLQSLFLCPVVATIHDLYPYECPDNFGYPNVLFNRWFLKQCAENSDGFSCVSGITLENLKRYFPDAFRKETTVVHNYVDFSQVSSRVPKSIDSNVNDRFLLCVAQHRKNKNLDILIQAYFQLIQNDRLSDSTKLVIVGSPGPETENIHAQIRTLSLEDRVLLLSSIDDNELCWLYQNCELFVIPSSTEGFCLPLAEAMYLSCKVVCSDIPIFKEIGSSECTYFNLEGEPVKNLSQAIIQTLGQPGSSKDSGNHRFSKSKAADQYLQFYSTVIEKTKLI